MPYLGCNQCHHEFEGCANDKCDWCGSDTRILEESTPLEKMCKAMFRNNNNKKKDTMSFKKFFSKVNETVQAFDFKAAGQTIVDTAKTTGTVLSQKGKEIQTHYKDLKSANAIKVKAESIEGKVAFFVDDTIIAEFKNYESATKGYLRLMKESFKNDGYVKIAIGGGETSVPIEHIVMMPLSEAYKL